MKKRFVSLCLAGLIMVAPASAVFTDISDSRVSQTAAVLDALGIMQGVGGGSFAPGKALTRAQFCKLGGYRHGCDGCESVCQLHDFSGC